MSPARVDVPDAELAVLKALWEDGAATIRRIADRIYPGGSASGYATVQKLLERLEARGCAQKEKAGRVNVYRARVAREELIRHRLRDAAEKLCDGSWTPLLTPLLTQLVDARSLSADEIRALRALVERLDAERTGGDS